MLLRHEPEEPAGIDDAVVDDEQFEVLVSMPSGEQAASWRIDERPSR